MCLIKSLLECEQYFLADIDKIIPKVIGKDKRTRVTKTILKNKNKVEGIALPDLNVATVITTSWCYWKGERHADQWDRTEN